MHKREDKPWFIVDGAEEAFDCPFDAIEDVLRDRESSGEPIPDMLKIYIATEMRAGGYEDKIDAIADWITSDLGAGNIYDQFEQTHTMLMERIQWAIRTCSTGIFEEGRRFVRVRIKDLGDGDSCIHSDDEKKLKAWWGMEQALIRNITNQQKGAT